MTPLNVLVSLHRGYGLGDAVQMSAVLRHVVRARPHWSIDLEAEAGRHCIGRGIVARTFEFGRNPDPNKHYDAAVEILLYDTWSNFHDRPNTRVSSCLHERFGLDWDAECGRYRIDVSQEASNRVAVLVNRPIGSSRNLQTRSGVVAVHYQGDSSPGRKNLTHAQATEIGIEVEKLGRVPLLIDWRGDSPLSKCHLFRSTAGLPTSLEWGRDAEMNCALIRHCEAFVGIDSGPSKCASATDTPALVIWTGHHPAPFHDPAPNTTHLVPVGYHGLEPVCDDAGVIAWFESHYQVRHYEGDPVEEAKNWLRETLRRG